MAGYDGGTTMKEFVIKFIPTDDDIRIGDLCYDYYLGEIITQDLAGENVVEYRKALKPFVCTRHSYPFPKVGELVFDLEDYKFEQVTFANGPFISVNNSNENLHNWVKVLGRLSDAAIWVKENDHFEWTDLKKYSVLPPNNFVPWSQENEELGYPTIFKVICPTCNTYH